VAFSGIYSIFFIDYSVIGEIDGISGECKSGWNGDRDRDYTNLKLLKLF